jgi:zinc transport system substrate-binding protein
MPNDKNYNTRNGILFAFIAILLNLSISTSAIAGQDDRLVVYTVNYPLQYFAERIGGDLVDVHFPAPDDIDPAFWAPDTETILAYQQADLVMLNGAGYAKWLNQVSLPKRKLIDTSAKSVSEYIRQDSGISHSHGPSGDHSHGDYAFTTWLDFQLAITQSRSIADALSKKRPQYTQTFTANLAALEADLLNLDQQMKTTIKGQSSTLLLASHPVYQYLTRRYELNLKSMHWEPDQYPSPEQWQALEKRLADYPAKVMIWEDESLTSTIEQLSSLGIESIVFKPSANRPKQSDFLSVMQQNIQNLQKTFQ